jgi:hypothetical protein
MPRKRKPREDEQLPTFPEPRNNGNAGLSAEDNAAADPEDVADLTAFAFRFPTISNLLWLIRDEQDNPIVTATLLIFRSGYEMTACLNDRHNGRKTFVNGTCVESALERLEQGLQDGTCEWKVANGPRP